MDLPSEAIFKSPQDNFNGTRKFMAWKAGNYLKCWNWKWFEIQAYTVCSWCFKTVLLLAEFCGISNFKLIILMFVCLFVLSLYSSTSALNCTSCACSPCLQCWMKGGNSGIFSKWMCGKTLWLKYRSRERAGRVKMANVSTEETQRDSTGHIWATSDPDSDEVCFFTKICSQLTDQNAAAALCSCWYFSLLACN